MLVRNFFLHLKTVCKHKWEVFKLCARAGIVWQGIVHDLSKFSFTEFWESAKYFQGNRSPIVACRTKEGYSKAWLHHKGRNKHHYQYWYDYECVNPTPMIPYKYVVEMICDSIAAGKVYNGKNWKQDSQLRYWQRTKGKAKLHSGVEKMLDAVYQQLADEGIKKTIQKKNLKALYAKYCE